MNPVVHFEIAATDRDKAKKFYADVFGWEFESYPMGDGPDYEIVRTAPVDEDNMMKEAGRINGGMLPKGDGEPGTVIVISVPSIDAAMEKVKANGGAEVFAKIPVSDMGFYARATDCDGNVIGLWEDVKKGE